MTTLNEQILARVGEIPMAAWDQRSAIGMARGWIEKREPIARAELHGKLFERRDNLAEDVVKMLAGSGLAQDEMIATLRGVRDEMDASFVDERMLGFQAGRAKLSKPGDKKKTEAADNKGEMK